MVHSVWMTELKFGSFTIDIRVWRQLPKGTADSIWIWCDHLKLIVSVLAIRFRNRLVRSVKSRSCVDFVEIVCRFHLKRSSRDWVSISLRSSISPGVH